MTCGRAHTHTHTTPHTHTHHTHTHTYIYIYIYIHISGQIPVSSQLFTNRGYLKKMLSVFVKFLDLWLFSRFGICSFWCVDTDRGTNIKVKCTLLQALRLCTGRSAHRASRVIALLFLDHGTRRGEGSASRPGRSLPPGKTRYPLYRRLIGPQGRSGQVRIISPLPGFDPKAVQPVASR